MFNRPRLLVACFALTVLSLAGLSPLVISPLAAQTALSADTARVFDPIVGIALSSDQQSALQAVAAEFAPRFQALAELHRAIRAAKRALTRAEADSINAVLTEHRARVRGVLTLEQQTQYDANIRRIQALKDSLRALALTTPRKDAR